MIAGRNINRATASATPNTADSTPTTAISAADEPFPGFCSAVAAPVFSVVSVSSVISGFLSVSSSSGIDFSADIISALYPVARESTKPRTPRITGSEQNLFFFAKPNPLSSEISMLPSGSLTATDVFFGPRIIIPSISA